jgi:predicted RNA methylase
VSAAPQQPGAEAAIWQDVEYGAYAADLPLWEELAGQRSPVIELGAGVGRVALRLAQKGVPVIAIDSDGELIAELEQRRGELPITAVTGSASDLRGDAAVVIAPLHLIQMLEPDERRKLLAALSAALAPGTTVGLVIVDEDTFVTEGMAEQEGPPDMREVDGWVYSSEPLWVQVGEEVIRVRRLRERVSPSGEMTRTVHDDLLHRISPDELEREASEAGLRPVDRREIPSGGAEADSLAVILEVP